jgi:hypothetical protein
VMNALLAAVILVTPSALANSHGAYDAATVSVSGVAENVNYGTARHPYVMYDLCDASAHCVRVVQFGAERVIQNQVRTATGKFRRLVFVDGRHVLNAIVIGRP